MLKNFSKFKRKHLCWNLVFNKVAGLRPFIRSRCLSGQIIVKVEICFSCHFIIWHVKKALKDWEGGGVSRYVFFYFKVSTISKAASGRKLGWYRYIWLSFYKVWQFQFVRFFSHTPYYKKWQNNFIKNVTGCYCKVGLKCGRMLLQSASGITKYESYYKVRRNT